MMSDSEQKLKKVGYKNPPDHSKWKKGQSGNPSGKKTKSESLYQIMKRLADQEVVVQKNGIQMSMTQFEAMLTAILSKAMKGDIACAKFIHRELGTHLASRSESVPMTKVTDADLNCLKSHADWVLIIEAAQEELDANEEDSDDADATW